MWFYFAFGVFVCTAFFYVPGFFIFRSLRFSRFLSVVSAPVATLVIYGLLSVVLNLFGIASSWALLFFGSCVFGVLLLAISFRFWGRGPLSSFLKKVRIAYGERWFFILPSPSCSWDSFL